MSEKKNIIPLRIALLYMIFGIFWILLTDTAVETYIPEVYQTPIQNIKGWLFVTVSAMLIFFFLRRELTIRTATEGKLGESESHYRLLFNSNPLPMWVYDLDTLAFIVVNDAAVKHYGYTREEFLAMTIKDIRPPEELPALMEDLPKESIFFHRLKLWKHRKKDGSIIEVEVSTHALQLGGHKARLVLVNDITERKQAEEKAIWLASFPEKNPNPIVEFDSTGNIFYINPAAEQKFPDLKEKSFNHPWLAGLETILPNQDTGHQISNLQREVHIGDNWYLQIIYYVPEVDRLRTYSTEITNRKQAERQILRLNRLYATLSQINQTIVHFNERDMLFKEICHIAIEYGKYRMAWIGLIDETTQEIKPVTFAGEEQGYLGGIRIKYLDEMLGRGPTGTAVRDKHCIISQDIATDPRMEPWRDAALQRGYHSSAAIPIYQQGVVVGVLTVYAEDAYVFNVSEENLLNEIGGDISFALDNIQSEIERKRALESLRQSEERFAKAFRSSPVAIVISRLSNGTFIDMNHAACQIYGYTREELVGHTSMELGIITPEERKKITDALQTDSLYANHEVTIHSRTDGTRTVLSSMETLEFDGEQCMLTAMIDITDRKSIEAALRQSEERYRRTLDYMLEGCQIIDFDWRYLYINDAAASHGHRDRIELVGHTMMEMYPGIENTYLFEVLEDCMKNRTPRRMQNEFAYPGGTTGWFDLSIEPIPEGLFILSVDITEHKRSEALLRKSEVRFHQLVNNIEEAFWITDPESEHEIYLSPAAEKIWGRSIQELSQHSSAFLENILPEDKPIVLSALEKQARGEQTHIEYRIQDADGSIRWVWDRAFPILDESGKVQTVAGLVADITERKQAEEQIRRQIERLKALSTIDNAINSSLDIRLTLRIFLHEALSQLKTDAMDVRLLNPHMKSLEYYAGAGFHTDQWGKKNLRLGEGLTGRAALERQNIQVTDLSDVKDSVIRGPLYEAEEFISYYGAPLIAKGELKGVMEVFNRSPMEPDTDWLDYMNTLAGQAAIAIDNAQLFERLQRTNLELMLAYDATIAGWSHALDLRDKETEGHSQRVTEMTLRLAHQLGIKDQELIHIRRGALLHDIGKLAVPDYILFKPGKLTNEEWALMRHHPNYAYDMLAPIAYLKPALDIPYCHHEKWDGTGYPRGLRGQQIPLSARIFAIVDVWDALNSDRPYRPAWAPERIQSYLLEQSGSHFDPSVVQEFMKILNEGTPLK